MSLVYLKLYEDRIKITDKDFYRRDLFKGIDLATMLTI